MSRQNEISENLTAARAGLPENITLIAVTKTFPISDIEILYDLGVRDFGENRDQEGSAKAARLPKDCTWHFQGQIQSNKIPSIVKWANYIHSLDNLSHAAKINKTIAGPLPVFLQVSLDAENERAGRGGIAPEALVDFIDGLAKLRMINPVGLMAVAPLNEDPKTAFSRLGKIKAEINQDFPQIKFLSAGMSHDFREAAAAGATHIRLGGAILGKRAPLT